MGWEFEHWDNGKVYLHNERWNAFREKMEKFSGYPHDWDHRRIFFHLHTPRDAIHEIPAIGDGHLKYTIEDVDNSFSVIHEPYPAFTRTVNDPEGWLSSWHIFAEDKHPPLTKESVSFLKTGDIFEQSPGMIRWGASQTNTFALFRGKFWAVGSYKDYGIGPNAPPSKVKKKSKHRRNIFEPFEEGW